MGVQGVEDRRAFADVLATMGAAGVGAMGLALLLGSNDSGMAFHGLLFLIAGTAAAIFILTRAFNGSPAAAETPGDYMDGPIKVGDDRGRHLGHRRLPGRRHHRLAARLSGAQPRPAVDQLRPPAAAAHLGGDLRLRRQRAARHVVLRRAAHVPRAPAGPLGAVVRRLGLPALHRHRRHRLSARHHPGQGVRRARVVRRPVADDRVGRLPARLPRHALQAQGAAHLRGELVLPRLHRHRSRCCTSSTTSTIPVSLGEPEELHRLLGRAGCDDAVVVRPQRGRLLPDRRLPRHHVLLHPEARGAAGLLLPPVDRALLDADLPLHLGRPAPPALHRAARLGADARHDVLDHAVDAVVGRHDQRPHDAVGRLGQAAHRSRRAPARRLGRLLRHVDVRGPADEHQGGQLAVALHRLDHRPRALRRARLGRDGLVRRHLLPRAVAVEPARPLLDAPRRMALLDRDASASCSTSPRCGCRASRRA